MLAWRSIFCLKLLTIINASPYRARASRPSAPLKNGIILLMAQPPLEKEGTELASTSVIDFEIACLMQSPEIRRHIRESNQGEDVVAGFSLRSGILTRL